MYLYLSLVLESKSMTSTLSNLDQEFEWIDVFNQCKNPLVILKCITNNSEYSHLFTFELEIFMREFLNKYPKSIRPEQVRLLLMLNKHEPELQHQSYDYHQVIQNQHDVLILYSAFMRWVYVSNGLRDALVENIEYLAFHTPVGNDSILYNDIGVNIYLNNTRYRNENKYVLSLTFACDCDDPSSIALFNLGVCYENGIGVVQNHDRARVLYLKATTTPSAEILKIYESRKWTVDLLCQIYKNVNFTNPLSGDVTGIIATKST